MRILVSNDDGFHAEGIQVLAKNYAKLSMRGSLRPTGIVSEASAPLTLLSHFARVI